MPVYDKSYAIKPTYKACIWSQTSTYTKAIWLEAIKLLAV